VKVGYVKPLGKIPVMREGRLVDGDATFLADALALDGPPEAVCPVVITQDLVMAAWRGEELRLRGRISAAVRDAEARSEVLLVGGTANLRDGIFLGLSPLEFIVNYDCRVVLLDRFEGEKSMDQVLSAVDALGPRFLGVVFNRVQPAQEIFVRQTVIPFFGARGVRVLGAVPSDPVLGSVSVRALADSLSASVACGGEDGEKAVRQIFESADVDQDGRLTRAEYEDAGLAHFGPRQLMELSWQGGDPLGRGRGVRSRLRADPRQLTTWRGIRPAPAPYAAGIRPRISSGSGKRPSCFFEKISFPSRTTSNCPPDPPISVASIPRAFLISAARLAARGR
jgi:hypothetical protein